MSSIEVCNIIEEGSKILPNIAIVKVPIADGGEGTVTPFSALGGEKIQVRVKDPLFQEIPSMEFCRIKRPLS